MTYGVKPEGFVRKPLPVIQAEIEAALRTEFGADLITTPQSPMGQIIGVFADITAEMWEVLEGTYQSHDPDQAEGTQLDTLGRLRNLFRNNRTDAALRQAITNEGRGAVDVQDISAAVAAVDGVTYSRVYANNGTEMDDRGLPGGRVAVVVENGDSEAIADAMRQYIAPGIACYGNTYIDSTSDGYCRSFPVVRPIDVPVTVAVGVRARRDVTDCPAPSLATVKAALVQDWLATRENGRDVSFYTVRQLIEARYPAVEVVTVTAERDDMEPPGTNQPVVIDFTEIASIAVEDLSVVSA